ncbi:uncharacterized protein LOC113834740 isoform X2 [Cricetulus griseus]|uniref:Uncharacterized protein LOC113834740 isoform X2 n=1 Tax=Cricetulus griseus TaxID=10029 RepID=A0A9J7GVL9_CRIGR|nr:uncharacterized protein LOC113834740 isoform X2 [Cricetulus griseus]
MHTDGSPVELLANFKDQQDPVWVPERLVRKVQHEECPECQHGDPSAPPLDEPAGGNGAEMGHPLSVSKTDTESSSSG